MQLLKNTKAGQLTVHNQFIQHCHVQRQEISIFHAWKNTKRTPLHEHSYPAVRDRESGKYRGPPATTDKIAVRTTGSRYGAGRNRPAVRPGSATACCGGGGFLLRRFLEPLRHPAATANANCHGHRKGPPLLGGRPWCMLSCQLRARGNRMCAPSRILQQALPRPCYVADISSMTSVSSDAMRATSCTAWDDWIMTSAVSLEMRLISSVALLISSLVADCCSAAVAMLLT